VGELARAIWLLLEGAISQILIHGDRGYSAAASDAAKTLVRFQVSYGSSASLADMALYRANAVKRRNVAAGQAGSSSNLRCPS
jgi:hypothetical protein